MSVVGVESDLVEYSLCRGEAILKQRSKRERKVNGQFLTPRQVARFMASQFEVIPDQAKILEPAVGSGGLVCAIVEQAVSQPHLSEIWIDGYETDTALLTAARDSLQQAVEFAAGYGLKVHVHLHEADFVQAFMPVSNQSHLYHGTLFEAGVPPQYDLVIANPPYYKLNSSDPRVTHLKGNGSGHTNIYTVFMSLCSKTLSDRGRACFIVPRSFCSGAYFANFRRAFYQQTVIEALHLFESRDATFGKSDVLQENVIIVFRARGDDEDVSTVPNTIRLSASQSGSELEDQPAYFKLNRRHFVSPDRETFYFRLPVAELDQKILDTVDGWPESLEEYGLKVSTGPVVPFRSRGVLSHKVEAVAEGQAVPLLWMNNIAPNRITWPVDNGKPQAILVSEESTDLLVPIDNLVLMRRFSAKEESRRLIAAPLFASDYESCCGKIGLENHLNYIYRDEGSLETIEVLGLSALLNSSLVDRYIRIVNGNTQVNAAELRSLPFPPLEVVKSVGECLLGESKRHDIDRIVFDTLQTSGYLPLDIPLFRETRITMGKIQEAQQILQELGLPTAQQNEISALTLLVLAQLSESDSWPDVQGKSLRIHDILVEIADRYDREYAENTRESIRRQVIHQFEQAGLVQRNPDDPGLPTNSPKTHYALSDLALATLRQYRTPGWEEAKATFQKEKGVLLEIYRQERQHRMVPLRLSSGEEYHLSPGEHNELQVAIVEEFGPRFAPGARLLYLGDTADKTLILDEEGFESLNVRLVSHDKLPDVVLYDEHQDWVYLVEAVTSRGPVSPKRYRELEEMFADCPAGRVYVSAFPDFATFKSFLTQIAWETEVWLAEIPDHMIHFNGDRFLGPHS